METFDFFQGGLANQIAGHQQPMRIQLPPKLLKAHFFIILSLVYLKLDRNLQKNLGFFLTVFDRLLILTGAATTALTNRHEPVFWWYLGKHLAEKRGSWTGAPWKQKRHVLMKIGVGDIILTSMNCKGVFLFQGQIIFLVKASVQMAKNFL